MSAAYRLIMERHNIDLTLLVDGGTDSIIFGDEPGCAATEKQVVLAAIGFGVDHYHGVSHHAFIENAARLIHQGGFLGVFSLTSGTPEAKAFLDLVDYANRRQPQHQSIVCNSIASALRGEFGNYHATQRTIGSELFINPLMAQYWTFEARHVVCNMSFAAEMAETEGIEDARLAIERRREGLDLRPRRDLPL